MTRVSLLRLAPVLLCILGLSVFLPEVWKRAVRGGNSTISGQFSALSGEFILWESGISGTAYRQEDGTPLSMRKARSLMPFMFFKDVQKWGGFPVFVGGRGFSLEEARESQYMNLYPAMISARGPVLHMLLESEQETASFALPDEFMAVDADGVRFLNCASGEENRDKSRLFTQAVREAGAVFPLKAVGHNPSNLKPVDEGMFFVDAVGGLFQLKMRRGAPLCLNTGLKVADKALRILVNENRRGEFNTVLVTEKDVLLLRRQGDLMPLPLEGYAPLLHNLNARFDPLNRTFILSDADRPASIALLAADKEYRALRRFSAAYPAKVLDRRAWEERGLSLLAPFHLLRLDPARTGVTLFFRPVPDDPFFVVLGMLIWTSLYLLSRRGRPWREQVAPCALCALFGLPALAPLLLFGPITEINDASAIKEI